MVSKKTFEQKQSESCLSAQNQSYVETLYEDYLRHSAELPEGWKHYFADLPRVSSTAEEFPHSEIQAFFYEAAKRKTTFKSEGQVAENTLQRHVDELVDAYREHGHLMAEVNPMAEKTAEVPLQLMLSTHQLKESDLSHTFAAPPQLLKGKTSATLKDIRDALKKTYCGRISIEYMYIRDFSESQWLQSIFENTQATPHFSSEQKKNILTQLVAADGLEKYLGSRYVGQKRFSLEGGDSFMPLMHEMTHRLSNQGAREVVIGMAHRGRLNVLVNLMGKEPQALLDEFEGKYKDKRNTSGDVKYHKGFSSDIKTAEGDLHLSLAFNPSHLEMISPVVLGSVRARQQAYTDQSKDKVVPILIHGDSAFSGQGIVMETLSMSQTRAYTIGGAIHVVINNQVGFTTSNPQDTRSSLYCTDVAKMIDAPILHVNGDDPEAVVFAAQIAVDYRMKFHKDIVIDLICYRRHGHNEADEPSVTQPLMYQWVRQHDDPWKIYTKQLIGEGVCTQEMAEGMFQNYRDAIDANQSDIHLMPNKLASQRVDLWKPYLNQPWNLPAKTGVSVAQLKALGQKLTSFPEGFTLQRQVGLVVNARRQMAEGKVPMDWGFAENLAYATLLTEGYHVRMTGQDVRRGTFAHRHAAYHDYQNGQTYIPLQHLSHEQASVEIYDSLLSEAGVVGFEYGYAGTDPNSLVIWEAQFGDFVNGAQIFIDQFISASWQKWERLSDLVMLLPHGYEGAGPEHSSARLERFLQLCAEDNMQVCVPSTPAQIFHLLRRQMLRPCRIPLIVMSPKSLLRHKLATSTLDELEKDMFRMVIPEIENLSPKTVKKVILCSGKVYYDLVAQRNEKQQTDVVIVRIEQLYPFPAEDLAAVLKPYQQAEEIVWCQEEPKNQGAWLVIQPYLLSCLSKGQTLTYAGRPAAASTAVGDGKTHNQQQKLLLDQAL